MKPLCLYLFTGFVLSSFRANTQNIAAYHDYKNYFYAFEDGARTEAENLPVRSFQVGGNAVAYVDNNGSFKVVYKGAVRTLTENIVSKYTATGYLISFSTYSALDVFDNGKIVPLSTYTESYSTGDSMVAFYSNRLNTFGIYYKGVITNLEDGATVNPLQSFRMGDNTFAYVNYLNQFKLFYRTKTITLATISTPSPYAAGKNVVAYYNPNNSFTIFDKWLKYDIETFPPKSFFAGDDLVAYVTSNQELKVYYEGKAKILTSFEPPFYKVADSLVVYNDAQKFKVFYNGEVYTLENYIPEEYRAGNSSVAYQDLQGGLKLFYRGKTDFVTKTAIDSFNLYRNVVSYRILNRNYIYCNSRTYPH